MSALLLFQRSSMVARLMGGDFAPGPDVAGAMLHSSSDLIGADFEMVGLATAVADVGMMVPGIGVEAGE